MKGSEVMSNFFRNSHLLFDNAFQLSNSVAMDEI